MEINSVHHTFHKSLAQYIQKKVTNTNDVEDIVQEVFIKIYQKIDTLKEEDKIQNWIFTIARNSIIDYYRKNKSKIEVPLSEYDDIAQIDSEEDNTKGMEKCLKGFINKLPEEYREIIIDSELKNIKQKDLAVKYNIEYSSLRSRVQRGRERIKKMLLNCCAIELDARGNIIEAKKINASENHCGDC